jgi:hypothetical protein
MGSSEEEVRPLSPDESALLDWLEQDRGTRETAAALPAPPSDGRDGVHGAAEALRLQEAESLARAWSLLDVLPRHESPPSLTSTTLEMVAVSADDGRSGSGIGGLASILRLAAAAGAILASLAAGYTVGLATRGDADGAGLALVPVAMHLGVLREAGSVAFLESLADREMPRLPERFGTGPNRPYPELERAVEAFVAAGFAREESSAKADPRSPQPADGDPTPATDGKEPPDAVPQKARIAGGGWKEIRAQLAALPPQERREVNDAIAAFERLPPGERRTLVELARALADPARAELVEAARLWHMLVQFADPVDRRGLLELDARERLEWIDRRMRPWRGQGVGPGGPSPRPGIPPFRPGAGPRRTP